MSDWLAIGYILSFMLFLLAGFMTLVGIADLFALNGHATIFLASCLITLFFGFTLFFLCRQQTIVFNIRSGLILTVSVWFLITFFAALPFAISPFGLNLTDSFFESMSGLTTTGATVFDNLDNLPAGLLLWRSILQWIGGMGIVFTAIAILPLLQVGGMELFPIQSSEQSDRGRDLQPVRNISQAILVVYLTLSVFCLIGYKIAGMSMFDAINHAMTTVAIGGFSTHDASLGYFDNPVITGTATIFMILASMPFTYYIAISYRNWRVVSSASQPRIFLGILSAATILIFITCNLDKNFANLLTVIFNTTSVMSGTGYSNSNYDEWGQVGVLIFFLLMFTGGCAGSATCGVKIFRLEVAFGGFLRMLRYRLYPHGVFPVQYNNRPLSPEVERSIFAFLVIYLGCFVLVSLLLQILGLEIMTAASAAASSLANVGPGLGNIIGPNGNYAALSPEIKWILAITMLIGRLEIIPVFGIFFYLFGKKS